MRVAIYCRISRDVEGEQLGVKRQEHDCRRRADREGWTVVEPPFIDDDIGASDQTKRKIRPQYQEMLAAAERREFDAILAYSNSRLTRRPLELEGLISLHERTGIRLFTVVSGDDDLSTADGQMVARIKASVDAAESKRISERTRRKIEERAQQGKPGGGPFRAYGFEPDKVTHRPAEVKVIHEVADRLLDQESLRSIAADLNQRGIKPPIAKQWTVTGLKSMIVNPRLAGVRMYKGREVGPATWQPILDRDRWEAVVAVANRNGKLGPHETSLLGGILRCGGCGAPMIASASDYRCDRVKRGPATQHVRRRRVPLDALINDLMFAYLQKHEVEPEPAEDPKLAEVESLIAVTEGKIGEIREAYRDDLMAAQDYFADLAALRDRVTALTRQRRKLLREQALLQTGDLTTEWERAGTEKKRKIIERFVDQIVVNPQAARGRGSFDPNTIKVVWRS